MSKRQRVKKRAVEEEEADLEAPIYESDEEDGDAFSYDEERGGAGGGAAADSEVVRGDFRDLTLKPDHASRPLWICPDGHVILETSSPVYKQAYDFMIAIAEPICRPSLMHEYQLTAYSLYAAAALGLKTEEILSVLQKLSKCVLPEEIIKKIKEWTVSYGKVKLVLQRNKFFLESASREILKFLARDPEIRAARVKVEGEILDENFDSSLPSSLSLSLSLPSSLSIPGGGALAEEQKTYVDSIMAEAGEGEEKIEGVQSFEISSESVVAVRRRCIELDYPLLQEYDFRNDPLNPSLPIDLKPTASIRTYQEKSLSKMFANGRARSGIIVLPCGAGKTLVGITAACTVKKSVLVLCTSGVSVEQWKSQFRLWSDIDVKRISLFTSDHKDPLPEHSGITITTYSMLAFGGKRSEESEKIMKMLRQREWGLILLDEVHVVPAHMFRKVLDTTVSHCKLGLTATLVREDEEIDSLNYLIGPKLYEANWLDLQNSGYIARVQCAEVWCPMTPEFYSEYLRTPSQPKKRLLYAMNPNKLRICKFLIDYHEERGDKIIVFADNLFALETYARSFGKLFLSGAHSSIERMKVLQNFQHNSAVKTIFISKVGDTSIDLPEATVIIQISSHFGSRRQEAQRLGRILRPKPKSEEHHNAFFYTLVSQDTSEMVFGTKRQQFLIDQGYSFKVVTSLPIPSDYIYSKIEDRLDLLSKVIAHEGDGVERLTEDSDASDMRKAARPGAVAGGAKFQRKVIPGAMMTGGAERRYTETKTRDDSAVYSRAPRHALFARRAQKQKEREKDLERERGGDERDDELDERQKLLDEAFAVQEAKPWELRASAFVKSAPLPSNFMKRAVTGEAKEESVGDGGAELGNGDGEGGGADDGMD